MVLQRPERTKIRKNNIRAIRWIRQNFSTKPFDCLVRNKFLNKFLNSEILNKKSNFEIWSINYFWIIELFLNILKYQLSCWRIILLFYYYIFMKCNKYMFLKTTGRKTPRWIWPANAHNELVPHHRSTFPPWINDCFTNEYQHIKIIAQYPFFITSPHSIQQYFLQVDVELNHLVLFDFLMA